MSHSDNHVLINNLCFSRDERGIFEDVTMRIQRGKITAIMGPSGTGKTTLLRLIGAELHPDSGNITFNDENIHSFSSKKLYEVRKKMGLLFQSSALFTSLSVFENVAFPLREHTALPEALIRDIVFMKLEAVGLRGTASLMPAELSGGMARRVAMARSIAMDPELMMYDEPFTGQDPISMAVLVKLIKNLNTILGMTSIVVSHDVKETCDIADYVYILSQGKIIGEGAPKELMINDNPEIKQFMHGLPDGVVPFHYPAKNYQEELLND
jgi:phospholipid/cholesterol/gamma-HCH transport system ATP-binding protein